MGAGMMLVILRNVTVADQHTLRFPVAKQRDYGNKDIRQISVEEERQFLSCCAYDRLRNSSPDLMA
jgi:hypothetical protein